MGQPIAVFKVNITTQSPRPTNPRTHPQEFARGLKKGTTSLVKGVVSGALNSVAGVGDSLNRQVALLSADRCVCVCVCRCV
jgi:hypothetical protein